MCCIATVFPVFRKHSQSLLKKNRTIRTGDIARSYVFFFFFGGERFGIPCNIIPGEIDNLARYDDATRWCCFNGGVAHHIFAASECCARKVSAHISWISAGQRHATYYKHKINCDVSFLAVSRLFPGQSCTADVIIFA